MKKFLVILALALFVLTSCKPINKPLEIKNDVNSPTEEVISTPTSTLVENYV